MKRLVLRAEQLDVLDLKSRGRFRDALVEHYRKQLPEQTAPFDRAALRREVEEAVGRARRLGIQSDRGIARFVGLSLVAGSGFDARPGVKELFDAGGMTGDEKVDLLTEVAAAIAGAPGGPNSAEGGSA